MFRITYNIIHIRSIYFICMIRNLYVVRCTWFIDRRVNVVNIIILYVMFGLYGGAGIDSTQYIYTNIMCVACVLHIIILLITLHSIIRLTVQQYTRRCMDVFRVQILPPRRPRAIVCCRSEKINPYTANTRRGL